MSGQKIIDGLNDALAFVRGDATAASLVSVKAKQGLRRSRAAEIERIRKWVRSFPEGDAHDVPNRDVILLLRELDTTRRELRSVLHPPRPRVSSAPLPLKGEE